MFKCVDPLRLLMKQGHVDCANNLLAHHQADTRVMDEKKLTVEDIIFGRHYRKEKEDTGEGTRIPSSDEDDSEDDGVMVVSPLPIQDNRDKAENDSGSELASDSESEDDDIFGPKGGA